MPKENDDKVEFDFDISKMKLGGLFRGLGNLIDLASKLEKEGKEKKGEIKGLPKGLRGVYGLSIRTLGNEPVMETFGNIRETAGESVVEEVSEPLVDIFDEGDHLVVIAELPGVSAEEIKVEVTGDIINLEAFGEERKYAKEILLPNTVTVESLTTAYKNGILKIRIEKA